MCLPSGHPGCRPISKSFITLLSLLSTNNHLFARDASVRTPQRRLLSSLENACETVAFVKLGSVVSGFGCNHRCMHSMLCWLISDDTLLNSTNLPMTKIVKFCWNATPWLMLMATSWTLTDVGSVTDHHLCRSLLEEWTDFEIKNIAQFDRIKAQISNFVPKSPFW